MAVAVDPLAAFARVTDVRVLGDDAHFARLVEEIGERLLLLRDAFPRGDRIAVVEMARAEDELLVFRQRHLGVLRAGVARPLRADPAQRAAGAAVHEDLVERFARRGRRGHPFRIDVGQGLRVLFGPKADERVHLAELELRKRRHPFELVLVGFGVEDFRQAVDAQVGDHKRAAPQRGPVTFADQRRGAGVALDGDDVARFQRDGVFASANEPVFRGAGLS